MVKRSKSFVELMEHIHKEVLPRLNIEGSVYIDKSTDDELEVKLEGAYFEDVHRLLVKVLNIKEHQVIDKYDYYLSFEGLEKIYTTYREDGTVLDNHSEASISTKNSSELLDVIDNDEYVVLSNLIDTIEDRINAEITRSLDYLEHYIKQNLMEG
ncbi:glutamyl-tRNA synthetase-like protein [Bacillus phage Shbh1]|uniref:Glutamyl-tRNA synthetase-like protein n=1 Tax=Bacillus phage Shbh1 TaxID=1796992 RepID=A0A142F161_9CAUD|nr:glutamyl-tRNA synthetase-like protein [Bacillus phage Shbh1]AMQ66518.1 glutamyl-tRNA synthetase-like protein [Bacillus phage Shbh1]